MRRGNRLTGRFVPVVLGVMLLAAPVAAGSDDGADTPAASVIGMDFLVTGDDADEDEAVPAVAWNDKKQEYLVVWSDTRDPSRKRDIWGRRISATGVPIGDDFLISGPGAVADDYLPAVAWNATNNQYLVVWEDNRNNADRGVDIYGRVLRASGAAIGPDFRISGLNAIKSDVSPDVSWNSNTNQYLVVWEDWRQIGPPTGIDIYGRRVSRTGRVIGGDFRISGEEATSHDYTPAVAYSATTRMWVVVWEDWRDLSTRSADIYGRRLAFNGRRLLPGFRICGPGAVAEDMNPQVAYSATGDRYLVVWNDDRNLGTRGDDTFGRYVSGAGAVAGRDFRISGPGATANERWPQVAWNATGDEHLVVWGDMRNVWVRGTDIYGRRVKG